MKRLKKAWVFFFVFCLCSCERAFVSDTEESIKGKRIKNYGSFTYFLSENPLSGIFSKEHYLIKAYFQEEGSKLELFSHFKGFAFEDGVKIQFKRKKDGLVVQASVQAYPEQTLFEREDYFLNSGEVDFTVEVENGTDYGFRVRVWENYVNRKGVVKTKTEILTGESQLADSLEEALTFYDKGQGLKWGIKLFRARLVEGARVSPKSL